MPVGRWSYRVPGVMGTWRRKSLVAVLKKLTQVVGSWNVKSQDVSVGFPVGSCVSCKTMPRSLRMKETRVQALVGGFPEDLSEEMVSREPLGAPGHLNYMEEGRSLGGEGSVI